ncbi:MAG: D-alanine--D-alanine ligase [Deltaproteobacteria bacterium]|nr:D-alanine--D-alanine ligase [Deltaproteobacteria bacterium]MBW2359721.1 D-alanine--D-alanine ligase [Deltaproteobacteria bacterium]
MSKLRVGLLFGGRSVEHEVSIASATSIHRALDPARYDVSLIGVDREGRWHLGPPGLPPEASVDGESVHLPVAGGARGLVSAETGDVAAAGKVDVIFPIVHGRGGEDGALQGLLEMAGVPYVGSGVLGSALQMDKEASKRLLRTAGLPVLDWVLVRSRELGREANAQAAAERALRDIGLPLFVKPANQGSSVGIHKVKAADELLPALRDAARYDAKILCERAVDAREIEVALLGNDPIEASVPGEIRTQREFYDYEAKYVDEDTELLVPAPLESTASEHVRDLAVRAMQALEGAGLGRVDFLLERGSGEFHINEVNSLPGFTDASMYPRLWEASGLPYPALLDRLIELALERQRECEVLETVYRRS